MILSATTDSLEMVSSVLTAAVLGYQYFVSYVDTSPIAFTPGTSSGSVTTATTTTLVSAPAAGHSRQVKELTVVNTGTTPCTITIQRDVSGANYTMIRATLGGGECLLYSDANGFQVLDSGGRVKGMPTVTADSAVLMAQHFSSVNLTSVKTITATNSYALLVGRSTRPMDTVSVRWRVTTAGTNISWAEVAIAKGSVNLGGNPTLTVVGYTDVSAVITGTGQFTTVVNVSAGQSIDAGDNVWVIIGQDRAGAGVDAVVRAASIADDLQSGAQASKAEQPSLNVGVASVYTVEAAATIPAWVAGIIA